ncbi:MAG TPA: hypothetical protein VNN77_04960 [candidate division Zixibacteria bacterium]|nr:hypothetical protein [candidate division Zixibacteria bacterium]
MAFNRRWPNRLLTLLSALSLALVAVNILLLLGNQNLQNEIGERQQFIAQSIQLEQLHRQVVTALAALALKNNDAQLKEMLAAIGIALEEGGPASKGAARAGKGP